MKIYVTYECDICQGNRNSVIFHEFKDNKDFVDDLIEFEETQVNTFLRIHSECKEEPKIMPVYLPPQRDMVEELTRVILRRVLVDEDAVDAWFDRPRHQLDNDTPNHALDDGDFERVFNLAVSALDQVAT